MSGIKGALVRILITGGTGFVGTHLIQFLKSPSSHIAILATSGNPGLESGVEYYEIDLRNANEVGAAVREFNPNQIYHLAGISSVDDSWANPRLTYEVNVFGAHNLFDAAMSLPSPPRILNVSTSQVYAPTSGTLTEESPIGPGNPYAASKAMAELLVVQYRKCAAGGIITARSFNHTGPGQPTNFVLPSIAKQFAEIESSLRPPKLAVGNIAVKRDFTDVRDVVQAYCRLLENGRPSEVYNVCSGSAVPLPDIIKIFQAIAGLKITIETERDRVRPNEVVQMCGDPKKIQKETGWYPQIPIGKMIKDLLDYWRDRCRTPSHTTFLTSANGSDGS